MALKNTGRSVASNGSQLQRSVTANSARGIHALGNLSRINLESRPLPTSYLQYPMTSQSTFQPGPPPLPPRRSPYASNMNRYSGMYNSYYPYSRFSSGYGGYGGYRMSPYGHYGGPAESYNSFIQMAEESTRPAFESIESVVEVVSSISMMLESTYHAVHSSYSAILGVVDQFSRLKDHLAQILSVLALIRGLKWLCLKVLYLLRLRKENPSIEAAWNSAEQMNGSPAGIPGETPGSAWPFLMFVGLVIGAPWLMFKLLSKSIAKAKPFDPSAFVDGSGKRYVAVAAYDFTATQPGELSFCAGEKLQLSPKSLQTNPRGWIYACNAKQETGLIPCNYLKTHNRAVSRNAVMPERQALSEVNIAIPESIPDSIDEFDDSVKPPFDVAPISRSPEQSDVILVDKSPEQSDATLVDNVPKQIGATFVDDIPKQIDGALMDKLPEQSDVSLTENSPKQYDDLSIEKSLESSNESKTIKSNNNFGTI